MTSEVRKKRMTKREARLLSEARLVSLLATDASNGQILRDEAARRMAEDGYATFYDWILAPLREQLGDLREQVAALQKRVRGSVDEPRAARASDDRENWELADAMLSSGWRGQGMREPSSALARIRRAVNKQQTWADIRSLPEQACAGAARFWEAAEYYWEIWVAAQEES